MAFNEIKNRDSWSTIRGFVYQVDTTILRWLDLDEHDVLELERGEDIDRVVELMKEETSRNIEQVKYREEASFTLNQETTLDILFNYFIHQRDNPSISLSFRFVTNAASTIERPALFPDGRTGIEVWMELFHSIEDLKNDNRLVVIKAHLQEKIDGKTTELSKLTTDGGKVACKNWKDFRGYIESNSNLIHFIKHFEWSLGNDDYQKISENIKQKLLRSQMASDSQKAESQYQRLFLFLFKLLSNNSLKRISRADLLNQVTLPALDSSDQRIYEVLVEILKEIEPRVTALEADQNTMSNQISSIVKTLEDSDTVFGYRLKNISLSPPLPVKDGTTRKNKVNEIVSILQTKTWVFLQGINGTGKSQLAALLCSEYKNSFWIELRAYNNDSEKSLLLIETCLSEISKCDLTNDRDAWVTRALGLFPSECLIIINDLPRLENGNPLSDLLNQIKSKTCGSGIRLVTTSNFDLPSSIKESNEELVHPYTDLEFTDDEIKEYLINSGASELAASFVNLIIVASKRNPRLVSAIIYHLRSMNWGKDSSDLVNALFKNEFSAAVLEDAQLSIKKFIKDDYSKELLYRLSLIHWDFEIPLVTDISEIEKKIIHPREKLYDLKNIWIQEREYSYSVSPLIHDIGEVNLPKDVINNVHIVIARSILSIKHLNVVTASRAITSFLKGKDYEDAGLTLIKVYQFAKSKEEINLLKDWGYLVYWTATDIPKEMSTVIRSFLRHEQIRIFRQLGKDTSYLVARLREYALEDSTTISEKVVINCINLSNYDGSDLQVFWQHATFVLNNWTSLDPTVKTITNPNLLASLLWVPIKSLRTVTDIEIWLRSIESFEKQFNFDFFGHHMAQALIAILCTGVTSETISSESKSQSKVACLDLLNSYFRSRKLEVLNAIVFRELIALEFQTNPNKAEELANQFTQTATSLDSKYLIFEKIGKLFFHTDDRTKSKVWLSFAANTKCTSQPTFIETLIYNATVISDEDKPKAIEFCEQALELARQSETYPELDYIQLLGELGIAHWLNEDFEKSFAAFENVVERLLNLKEKSFAKNWIRVFSWSGHALGYIAPTVARERPPQKVLDGSEYTKPYQGLFSFNNSDLSDRYEDKNIPIILGQLALFADGLNNISKAYQWSLRAFDLARKNGDDQILTMVSVVCGQFSLANFKLEEAFESYLLSTAVSSHVKGDKAALKTVKLATLFSHKPSEEWNNAEDSATSFAIIPLFIMVLTSQLENSEDKDLRAENFNRMIKNYIPRASNKNLWEVILELAERIVRGEITQSELLDRSNKYADSGQKNLQMLCIIGAVYSSKSYSTQLTQMINVLPYLVQLFSTTRSVIKFCLIPFVKNRCINIYKNIYVGDRQTLNDTVTQIETVDLSSKNAIQIMLQPVFNELKPAISDGRRRWLFEYQEI